LARTDANLTTLFHSFYLVEFLKDSNDTKVVQRYPQDRVDTDAIESGLKLFLVDALVNRTSRDTTGSFILTPSSFRYFAFFRGFDTRMLVAVSNLPIIPVARRIFDLLDYEVPSSIPATLLTLCELPVFPGAGLQYDVGLGAGEASVRFSSVEQVEDVELDHTVLSIMTPMMLVKAWEALVLERKVLVMSSVSSVIPAVCEFLRRMVSPLNIINTYVPLLSLQLIETVEAPTPYLLGANTKLLKENIVDLSDTVVVDLDMRTVIPRLQKPGSPDTSASINLVATLASEINSIMLSPCGEWYNRPTSASCASFSPFNEASYVSKSVRILEAFKRTNLELISARTCSVRAFWRRRLDFVDSKGTSSRRPGSTVKGFNYESGICSGFMQLAKELHEEEAASHFISCWVEMDQYVLSVYQYADDLPILFVLVKDIETVAPCALEPEGHVFELVVKDNMSYRMTVTDTESRQKWISTIDRRKSKDFSGYEDSVTKEEVEGDAASFLDSTLAHTHISPSHSVEGPLHEYDFRPAPYAGPTIWNGYEIVPDVHNLLPAPPLENGKVDVALPIADRSINTPSALSTATLGLPEVCPLGVEHQSAATSIAQEDSCFRLEFARTQTMNFIHGQVECPEYQQVFQERKIGPMEGVLDAPYILDESMEIVRAAPVQLGVAPTSLRGPAEIFLAKLPSEPLRKSRSKFFGGIFNKRATAAEDMANNAKMEIQRLLEAEKRQDKLAADLRRATIQAHMFVLTATYRRLLADLNTLIVEARQAALEPVVCRHAKGGERCAGAIVKYPVREIVAGLRSTPRPRSVGAQLDRAGAYAGSGAQEPADVTEEWVDKMWLALTDETWAQYARRQGRADTGETGVTETALEGSDIDDIDVQQGTNEALLREQIKRRVLGGLQLRHDLLEGDSLPYQTVSNVLLGHLHEVLEDSAEALHFYAQGALVDQSRIMSCLVQELLLRWMMPAKIAQTSRSLSQPYPHAGSSPLISPQASPLISAAPSRVSSPGLERLEKMEEVEEQVPESEVREAQEAGEAEAGEGTTPHTPQTPVSPPSPLPPTQEARSSRTAVSWHPLGDGAAQAQAQTLKLAQEREEREDREREQVLVEAAEPPIAPRFVQWAEQLSPLIGKQAYRLVIELMYRDLAAHPDLDSEAHGWNRDLELGSFRTFPGSHRNVGAAQLKSARARSKNSTIMNSDFDCVERDKDVKADKADPLNALFTCVAINEHRSATEVSVLLLTALKEIVKTYCQSPAGIKNSKKTVLGLSKLKLTGAAMEDLASTSAFKAFEQHCCILQKLDLDGLSVDERMLFFCNVFNTIITHAVIARGAPGTSVLERSAFMRSCKYIIGGSTYSLMDIEHGILRNKSSSPMIFGPLTISTTFHERDPRRKYILEEARPNISFVLCSVCVSSPALVVLKDVETLDAEVKHYARRYFHEFVRLDPDNKCIVLPELIKYYWADFGGNRAKVLKTIAQISGAQFATAMKPFISPAAGVKAKVEFSKFDWSPVLSVSDS